MPIVKGWGRKSEGGKKVGPKRKEMGNLGLNMGR
jgi:hypothetical protein